MKKDEQQQKKKLVLRKDSIRALDQEDLSAVGGGMAIPPDGGVPPRARGTAFGG
jgi:hypothetical protein